MSTLTMVLSIVHLVVCVILIAVIILQSGKDAGLSGAISGGNSSDTFYGKNKSRTLESRLEKATAFIAILFVVLTLVLY